MTIFVCSIKGGSVKGGEELPWGGGSVGEGRSGNKAAGQTQRPTRETESQR